MVARSRYSRAIENKAHNDWRDTIRHQHLIPSEFSAEWVPAAEEIAFALGMLSNTDDAAALVAASVCPNHDAANTAASFCSGASRLLSTTPTPSKTFTVLVFSKAQIENNHDAVALRWLEQAIGIYRQLSPDQRADEHWLRKPYLRALYAAARSALRLGQDVRAQRHIFACVREDEESNFTDPTHKLYLAGRCCAAAGQRQHAERAFKLALTAAGEPKPPQRLYILEALTAIAKSGRRGGSQ